MREGGGGHAVVAGDVAAAMLLTHSGRGGLDTEALSVCPECDMLYRRKPLGPGEIARCLRCGSVIETRKPRAVDRMLLTSVATVALMALAVSAPFLTLREAGLERRISLIDVSEALTEGGIPLLGLLVLAATILLPAMRAMAHVYALAPVRLGWGRAPLAALAMRWSSGLRPWAMAEIFMIGVAVSLTKLAGIATIDLGPAFWALGGAVAVIGFENAALCRETIWNMLGEEPRNG